MVPRAENNDCLAPKNHIGMEACRLVCVIQGRMR